MTANGNAPDLPEDLRLLRRAEVEQLLGLGRTKVLELIRARELEPVRVGTALRVTRASVRAWIARQRGIDR